MKKSQPLKSFLSLFIKLGVAGLLIYWIINKQGFDLKALALLLTPVFITEILVVLFLIFILNNLRWYLLLTCQGIETTFVESLKLTFIGVFFNYAMPGGVGGDVVKAFYLAKENKHRRGIAILSVLMDRLVGFFCMLLVAFFIMVFHFEQMESRAELIKLGYLVSLVFFAFVIFFSISFSRRVGKSHIMQFVFHKMPGGKLVHKIYENIHSYRHQPKVLIQTILISLASQSLGVFIFILTGEAMGLSGIPLSVYFFTVPLGYIAMSIPLAPGGLGVGQAAFFVLFNWSLGQVTQLGPNAITFQQVGSLLFAIPGLIFYLSRKEPHMEEELAS